MVHIDFGIAFESGKTLPSPETIPFRLTREVIAGMGITGVEGLFKNSSAITLNVIKENQLTLMGILEVLLYDPLYTWTMTAAKARRTQSLEFDPDIVDEDKNTSAERALQCILSKINGRDGTNFVSVEGQVNSLIQQATNEKNLCRLFVGWQPYY